MEAALEALSKKLGSVDFQGADHPFDVTDFYETEMGKGLRRRLVSFERLVQPESLVEVKTFTNGIESSLSSGGRRRVNIDSGYLDHSKVVLGSMKFAGQKIHLGSGVWADMILRWEKGTWRCFDWTFPDFRMPRYWDELATIRRIYMEQLRALRKQKTK